MRFDPTKYLKRINYSGDLNPNLDLLIQLQYHHLMNIPFENLDIHNKSRIQLNIDRMFEKVVVQKRGGFCYELNGLFYELLSALGFDAKCISARVYGQDKEYSPEYDHLTIVVRIDHMEYLSDVGFGDFTYGPLALQLDKPQKDLKGMYVVRKHTDEYLQVSKIEEEKISPEFIFKNTKRELTDFTERCWFHQSNPNSHFMKKRLISLPTKNGRITITGNTLKILENDKVVQKQIKSEREFENELWKNFKIRLTK